MRIDKYLSEKFGSRNKAAAAIAKGLVSVNGKRVDAAYDFNENDKLEILQAESYVSVGGYKLAKAIKDFGYSPLNKVYADIGASTGGFTDCLLKNGAAKVYCIDVGESQLDKSLLNGKTVVIDNFNARNLDKSLFSEKLDGVVIDVSFISLTYILGAVSGVLDDGAQVLALIKPQFECESRKVGKNGIVRDAKLRESIVRKILEFSESCGLVAQKITLAPIVKGKNIEYVVLLEKGAKMNKNKEILIKSIKILI